MQLKIVLIRRFLPCAATFQRVCAPLRLVSVPVCALCAAGSGTRGATLPRFWLRRDGRCARRGTAAVAQLCVALPRSGPTQIPPAPEQPLCSAPERPLCSARNGRCAPCPDSGRATARHRLAERSRGAAAPRARQALHIVIVRRDVEAVLRLLQRGADVAARATGVFFQPRSRVVHGGSAPLRALPVAPLRLDRARDDLFVLIARPRQLSAHHFAPVAVPRWLGPCVPPIARVRPPGAAAGGCGRWWGSCRCGSGWRRGCGASGRPSTTASPPSRAAGTRTRGTGCDAALRWDLDSAVSAMLMPYKHYVKRL